MRGKRKEKAYRKAVTLFSQRSFTLQILTIYKARKETIMTCNRSKWLSLLVVLAVLALGGYYAFTRAQAADAENEKLVLEFDVAEDMTRFVFAETPVDEN